MWNKNKKADNRKSLLKQLNRKKKYYTDEVYEILINDIIDDLKLDTKEQKKRFYKNINYLINEDNLTLTFIKNSILSNINAQYLNNIEL